MILKRLFTVTTRLLASFFAEFNIGDLFCIGGFVLLGAGLWEVSRALALCTLGGLMLIIWLVPLWRAASKGGRR